MKQESLVWALHILVYIVSTETKCVQVICNNQTLQNETFYKDHVLENLQNYFFSLKAKEKF